MGDSVSYGREYTAERATWIATLPVGHTDGYPRKAVNGARVLINGALYPAIGAVTRLTFSDSIDLPDAGAGQLDEVIIGIAEVEASAPASPFDLTLDLDPPRHEVLTPGRGICSASTANAKWACPLPSCGGIHSPDTPEPRRKRSKTVPPPASKALRRSPEVRERSPTTSR